MSIPYPLPVKQIFQNSIILLRQNNSDSHASSFFSRQFDIFQISGQVASECPERFDDFYNLQMQDSPFESMKNEACGISRIQTGQYGSPFAFDLPDNVIDRSSTSQEIIIFRA
jgi:hypothetical protein